MRGQGRSRAVAWAGGAVFGFLVPGSRWEDVPVAPPPARASAEGLRTVPAGRSGVRVSYTLPF